MPPDAPAPDRPNIIVILVDDMGYSDLGCFGSRIQTPNLDRMAEGGMTMTQMYNCARCCPTRASLLTGLYPHQAGIGLMVGNRGYPSYQGYLRDDTATIAEALGAAGYRTVMSGKWHVGGRWDRTDASNWRADDPVHPLPIDRGFEEWYGTPSGAGGYFNPKPLMHNREFIEPDFDDYYYTDAVSRHACRMIRETPADQPFFLYTAYTAPHWPLHAREEDIARYEGVFRDGWGPVREGRWEELKARGLLDSKWDLSPRHPDVPDWDELDHPEWRIRQMAVYAAMVESMDRGVGQILKTLRATDREENTLVLFLSDNGASPEGISLEHSRDWPTTVDGRPVRYGDDPEIMPGPDDTFQAYRLPWANVSSAPFRLFKSYSHEGGSATPLLARWPKRIPAGGTSHRPAHVVDLMATCLDAAGAAYPEERDGNPVQPTEGESFLPLLAGRTWNRSRPFFIEHEGTRCVRDGQWKLVSVHETSPFAQHLANAGEWELFNMAEDRTELNDLAEADRPRRDRMAEIWEDWARRVGVVDRDEILGRK